MMQQNNVSNSLYESNSVKDVAQHSCSDNIMSLIDVVEAGANIRLCLCGCVCVDNVVNSSVCVSCSH